MQRLVQLQTERQDYETPWDLVLSLSAEFGPFDVDVAASEANKKAPRCFTAEVDGLKQDWTGLRCWMNPPYGRMTAPFVKKAAESDALTVALLPARTDTRWFHDHVYGKAEVRFLKGRVKFWMDGKPTGQAGKFPSMIVIWNGLRGNKVSAAHPKEGQGMTEVCKCGQAFSGLGTILWNGRWVCLRCWGEV